MVVNPKITRVKIVHNIANIMLKSGVIVSLLYTAVFGEMTQ